MADPLIDVAALEARLGYSVDVSQADARIEDASALVRDIVSDDVALDPVPSAIVPVVVSMVHRALDNPHGHESETVGNYTFRGAKTAGVFATPDEVRAILRAVGKQSGLVSVSLSAFPLPES